MISNVIHFIYGLEEDYGCKPFLFAHYLAIRSAFEVNNPDVIYFYYSFRPTGKWWTASLQYITPQKVEVPQSIFGKKLCHYAHKADVLRIEILLRKGGTYLDIDTICVKPLRSLQNFDCVMGLEMLFGREYGLCNALIMASPNSSFLKYWYSSYSQFRSEGYDGYWSEHSVQVPFRIAKLFPQLIEIQPETSFFYPSYTDEGLKMLFEQVSDFPEAYIFHLWESRSYHRYLSKITPESIKEYESTYNLIARKYL